MARKSSAGRNQSKTLKWGAPPPAVEAINFDGFYKKMMKVGTRLGDPAQFSVEVFDKKFVCKSRIPLTAQLSGPTWGVRYTVVGDNPGYPVAFAGSTDDFLVDIVALRMYLP